MAVPPSIVRVTGPNPGAYVHDLGTDSYRWYDLGVHVDRLACETEVAITRPQLAELVVTLSQGSTAGNMGVLRALVGKGLLTLDRNDIGTLTERGRDIVSRIPQ